MMVKKVADSMVIAVGATDYTQSMPMGGGNCIQAHAIGENMNGATSYTLVLEGTVDWNNWSAIVTWAGNAGANSFPTKQTGIGFAGVRCKVTGVGGTGPIVFSLYLCSSQQ